MVDERLRAVGYVFAFGSLVNPEEYHELRARFQLGPGDTEVYCLNGFRRVWDVAMDNAVSISGYKRYADPAGAYPEVFVAFADIEAAPGGRVHGVLIPVHQRLLDHLDRRERNYTRTPVAVHDKADGRGALPIWAYLGSDNGKERFRAGQLLQRVCVSRDYRDRVVQAYQARGLADQFQAEDAGFDLEVRELTRITIPVIAE